MITTQKILGDHGEALVEQFIRKNNFKVIAKNYRQRHGEIDLVATHKEIVAFIEVKTRTNPTIAPSTAITTSKQRRIFLTAKSFIAEHKLYEKVLRFDVALISIVNNQPTLEYIPNAFVPSL